MKINIQLKHFYVILLDNRNHNSLDEYVHNQSIVIDILLMKIKNLTKEMRTESRLSLIYIFKQQILKINEIIQFIKYNKSMKNNSKRANQQNKQSNLNQLIQIQGINLLSERSQFMQDNFTKITNHPSINSLNPQSKKSQLDPTQKDMIVDAQCNKRAKKNLKVKKQTNMCKQINDDIAHKQNIEVQLMKTIQNGYCNQLASKLEKSNSEILISDFEKQKLSKYWSTNNKFNIHQVADCNVDRLKKLPIKSFKDSNFFQDSQNAQLFKRLLFLQYQSKQIYIHQHQDISFLNKTEIPFYVVKAFQDKNKFNFFKDKHTRNKTQETHDTSNPSNQYSPYNITPRSNDSNEIPPNLQDILDPIIEMEEMKTENNNFYGMNTNLQYCYYGYNQYYGEGYMMNSESTNRKRKSISWEESKNFKINIALIQKDQRTTIMIKNIPNKYTQQNLLELIHKNHKKKIDFFYLPIDYKNQCNVGYAFINFIDVKYITAFYSEFNGKKWKKYNSEKICQLTYARLQGTTSLVNHFQNSMVMNQKDKKMGPLIGPEFINNLSSIIENQKKINP